MRKIAILSVVVGLVVGAVLTLATAAQAAPPRPSQPMLDQQLNGEPRRWRMVDAGWSGTFGSGVQCMPVQDSASERCAVIEMYPSAAAFLCMGQALEGTTGAWDGGCLTTPTTDPNYGTPLAATTLKTVVLQPGTTTICVVPATGSVNNPVWCKR